MKLFLVVRLIPSTIFVAFFSFFLKYKIIKCSILKVLELYYKY